jgi:oligopeptide transport system ATP-binding protein
MTAHPALEVRDLRKVFRVPAAGGHENFVAVDQASFTIAPGGCLAVVGESGSGKTTIARIVAGLETATSGTVRVEGETRPPLPWPRRDRLRLARQVQMVFQDPNSSLDPAQTLHDSLEEVLRHHTGHGAGDRRDRIQDLLRHVGLDDRHRLMRPRALSGGERQRAALARALAAEPRLLILDESVSALDVSVQAHVLNLLADLRQELGLTYLFISHDLGVVRQVSDDCLVLRHGVVQESGRTGDVLDNPTSPYTQALLEAVPRPGWRPSRRTLQDVTP